MTWTLIIELGTTVLNLAVVTHSIIVLHRRNRQHAEDQEMIRQLLPCAGLVALLARGPSVPPEQLRSLATRMLPRGINVTITAAPPGSETVQ